jgi:Fe-S-cluster containining protein
MFTKLQNLYHFVDQTVEMICLEHAGEVTCTAGCADCCHGVFDISFIEAAYLATFLNSHQDIFNSQQQRARQAAIEFEKLTVSAVDLSTARIRCPLLGEDNLCLAHAFRPVNCRTYGTPTIIDGKAHVCGISGFTSKRKYPSVDLAPLQKSLNEYSVALVGEDFGNRRFPIAWVFLQLEFFLPRREK